MKITLKVFHWLCRCALAGIFLYSGYVKLKAPLQFAVAISGYKLVPENLIFPLATYLPWIEVALGLGILIGWKIRYFSAGAAALLMFFIAILAITISRGIEANCGCFSLDAHGRAVGVQLIVQDAGLLVAALVLACLPPRASAAATGTP